MPEQLFIFIQMEFPWELGPPDGRYLIRDQENGEPRHVLVLGTLGARRSTRSGTHERRPRRWRRSRGGGRPATPEPAPVPTTRVTVIDPVPLAAEQQARAWLGELNRDRDVRAAAAVVNRALHLHRIAAADPYVHEVSPAQALVIRAGWGEGEQVADGRWLHAREIPFSERSPGAAGSRRRLRGRSAALRSQERLAALLGARNASLMCEEHALRARADLDQGRRSHAAVELDRAYAAALVELPAEGRQDLALRLDELAQLGPGVAEQARAALPGALGEPDEEVVHHALERLEAALRARTAAGFSVG